MGQRAPSACLLRKQIVYNLIWTILHREPTALLDSLHEHTVGRFKLDPKWNRTQDHSVKKKLVCLNKYRCTIKHEEQKQLEPGHLNWCQLFVASCGCLLEIPPIRTLQRVTMPLSHHHRLQCNIQYCTLYSSSKFANFSRQNAGENIRSSKRTVSWERISVKYCVNL